MPKIHQRQFVFSNARIEAPKGWISIDLRDGFFLHHCPLLNVASAIDNLGRTWILVGHAFNILDDSLQEPLAGMASFNPSDIFGVVENWSGRWLLLCSSAVITDAAALLGTYVAERDNDVYVSSSLALLSQLTGARIRDRRVIGWHGFNWYPGPLCKLEGVRKLLPDQIYNPSSRSLSFFNRLPVFSGLDLIKTANEISHGLTRVFRAIARKSYQARLYVTLTGGLDSRTTFSIIRASGVPFTTLTLEHPRISVADLTLPSVISAGHDIDHKYISGQCFSDTRLDEYDFHTYGCAVDGDRYFYANNRYNCIRTQDWLIRSGCWEFGRKYFHHKLAGLSIEEVIDRPARLISRFKTFFGTEASAESLREWARWRLENPIPIPWQDLFYRDQRLGGWLSAIEQSLDLIDGTSLQPVNCDRFYGLMLAVSDGEDSSITTLQREIIARCTPELADVPINPVLGRSDHVVKNMLSKISTMIRTESQNVFN